MIYAAPHPNWGSSGIRARRSRQGRRPRRPAHARRHVRRRDREAVSRDPVAREHAAAIPFVDHTLAQMPGVHRAPGRRPRRRRRSRHRRVGAAGRRLGRRREDAARRSSGSNRPRPGTFARHTIEMGFPRHATLDVGDVDGDGDLDIVTGNFSIGPGAKSWVDVWVNGGKAR